MNAFVQSIPRYIGQIALSASPFGQIKTIVQQKMFWLTSLLVLLIFISALGVVYDQDQNRNLFSELVTLHKQRDKLYVRWGQLLLEESTWSNPSRIQRIASQKLQMVMPQQKNVVIVTE